MKKFFALFITVSCFLNPATIRIYNQTSTPMNATITYGNGDISNKKTIDPNDYRLFDSSLHSITKITIYEDSGTRSKKSCALAVAGSKPQPGYIPLKVINVYEIPIDIGTFAVEKKIHIYAHGHYESDSSGVGSGTVKQATTIQEEDGDCRSL